MVLPLMLLVVTGCVTAEELDQRLNTWVGQDSDLLAGQWGAPTGNYDKKDGGSILSYDKLGIVTTGASPYMQTFSRSCRVDFVTNEQGIIVGATWHGAPDQCDRTITPKS